MHFKRFLYTLWVYSATFLMSYVPTGAPLTLVLWLIQKNLSFSPTDKLGYFEFMKTGEPFFVVLIPTVIVTFLVLFNTEILLSSEVKSEEERGAICKAKLNDTCRD